MPSHQASGTSPARGSPAFQEMEPKDQPLTVALRIRPLSEAELEEGATVIAHKVGDRAVLLLDPGEDAEDPLRANRSRERTFTFDAVFDQSASQGDVYRATIRHLVEGVISGYNATVFAYGPSGAGKTHTMLGVDAEPGIYLQTLGDLFQAIEEARDSVDYSVSVSYFEIYNEVIRDLLNPSSEVPDLREDSRAGIQVTGITEVSTANAQEIMRLLTRGNRQRTQESTATNQASSRSHAVLQVTVRQQSRGLDLAEETCLGRLFMVDLAGSERASQTQTCGRRLKEGAHINRSLLALGNCITALSERAGRAQYVNFRDSKLTRLLKDALGGNSRTVMIAHISPASSSFEESRSTLLYAHRARSIKTRVRRNLLSVSDRMAQYTDIISDLHREIELLKSKIEKQETKRSEPGIREVQAPEAPHDSHQQQQQHGLQMRRLHVELAGAFREPLDVQGGLLDPEGTSPELQGDSACHLLTIAEWEQKSLRHGPREGGDLEADPGAAEATGEEPLEVALAREEVALLSAEHRKTAALKAGLERQLAGAKQKVVRMQTLLRAQVPREDERAALGLLCRAHELEVENAELQATGLCQRSLLCHKDLVIRRCQQHWQLCQRLICGQRRLLQDSGIAVPEALDRQFRLYSRELGAGTLGRLLLLHTGPASLLRDAAVLSISAPPEDCSPEQPEDRTEVPCGPRPQLPPLRQGPGSDGKKSPKATPLRKPAGHDSLLPRPALRTPLTPPALEVTEKPWPPSGDRVAESQPSSRCLRRAKSSGKILLPAVPSASRMKPGPSCPAGSTDSRGQGHSPLSPSRPRRREDNSAKRPRRPR